MENQPQSSDNASSIPPEPQISQAPIPESLMNCGFPLCPNWGAIYPSFAPPVFPYMYPAWVLTFQPQDLHQQSGGIYAVPVLPYMAATSDFTPIGLIPLSYSIPSRYRLGAFAPLLRWLSQSARRAMVPARDPARAFQVRQDVAPGLPGEEDVQNDARQLGQVEERQDFNWRGFLKEIQMIAVGFVASLVPGFQLAEN